MIFPVVLALFVVANFVSSDDDVPKVGCPPAHVVEPCVCSSGPHPILVCKHIDDPLVLVNIFDRSSMYWYQEVRFTLVLKFGNKLLLLAVEFTVKLSTH